MKKNIKPVNKERKVKESDLLVTKTDGHGNIIYGNKKFFEITRIDEADAIGTPHNINRHPDMPRSIFYLLWKTIKKGKDFRGIIKNIAMDGKYYWVVTTFEAKIDDEGDVEYFIAYRKGVPKSAVKVIEPIYKEMKEIEKLKGRRSAVEYLENILEKKGISYNEFIDQLLENKKSFWRI